MRTKCNMASSGFQAVSGRAVVADFDGGDGGSVTSDAGAVLLGQVDAALSTLPRREQAVARAVFGLPTHPRVKPDGTPRD